MVRKRLNTRADKFLQKRNLAFKMVLKLDEVILVPRQINLSGGTFPETAGGYGDKRKRCSIKDDRKY